MAVVACTLASCGPSQRALDDDLCECVRYSRSAADVEELTALLAKGANPSARCDVETALSLAVSRCRFFEGTTSPAAALLARRANVNQKDNDLTTPLLRSITNGCGLGSLQGLIAAGADVQAFGPMGETALLAAARGGKAELVAALLAAHADPSRGDARGDTPLMAAARDGYVDVLKALLASGADVNARSHDGATALLEAAAHNRTAIMRLLQRAGADRTVRDRNGRTAAMVAADAVRRQAQFEAEVRASLERDRREEEPYAHFRTTEVLIIDSGFDAYGVDASTAHGRLIEHIIRAGFAGSVQTHEVYTFTDGRLSGSDVFEGIRRVIRHTTEAPHTRLVVNLSWGTDAYHRELDDFYAGLSEQGVIFVAAAGNRDEPRCAYPAGYRGVIGVGSAISTTAGYEKASYSSYGSCVQVAVLQEDVEQLLKEASLDIELFGRVRDDHEFVQRLARAVVESGTSFAAARVTAALAGVLMLNPRIPPQRLVERLPGDSRWVEGFSGPVKVLAARQ